MVEKNTFLVNNNLQLQVPYSLEKYIRKLSGAHDGRGSRSFNECACNFTVDENLKLNYRCTYNHDHFNVDR